MYMYQKGMYVYHAPKNVIRAASLRLINTNIFPVLDGLAKVPLRETSYEGGVR